MDFKLLIDRFFEWYRNDPHSDSEEVEDYQKFSKSYFQNLEKEEFIDVIFKFGRSGGRIQSGGYRTAGTLKKSIEIDFDSFRDLILNIYSNDFDLKDWWEKANEFKGFGIGIRSIFLHRCFPDKYAIYNNKSKKAFQLLGLIPERMPRGEFDYEVVTKGAQELIKKDPKRLNLYRVDSVSEFIIAREPGQQALKDAGFLTKEGEHLYDSDKIVPYLEQYQEFKKSETYNEQYKWEFIKKNSEIFTKKENLQEDIIIAGKTNLAPWELRTGKYSFFAKKDANHLWKIFQVLFDEKRSLEERVNSFISEIGKWALNSPDWKNKKQSDAKVETAAYFLFLRYPDKYLLFSKLTPFNNLKKIFNLSDELTDTSDRGKQYAAWLDFCRNALIPLMNNTLGSEHDLLDCQDFIWTIDSYPVFKDETGIEVDYWKIAPGENAFNWKNCLDGEFIAIGWDLLGDISQMNRKEFESRLKEIMKEHEDWTESGAEQTWKFAHIQEGDRIIANRGISEILGIGTVTGPYYFVPDIRHGHQLPVRWEDTTVRQIDEQGWRRTLVQLDRKKFEELTGEAESKKSTLAFPFDQLFKDEDEARWAFSLLKKAFDLLEIKKGDDEVFSLTYNNNNKTLRLNYGNWAVIHFRGPEVSEYRVGITLTEDLSKIKHEFQKWEPFTGTEPPISGFEFLFPMKGKLDKDLGKLMDTTFKAIHDRFKNWERTNLRKFNQPEIVEAVLNPDIITSLLKNGISKAERGQLDEELEYEPVIQPEYTLEAMAEESGFKEAQLKRWINALERKGQVIFYGPPGTGKTFIAERVARHIISGSDGFLDLVQFHPSYAYEDFIQGIRPRTTEDLNLTYPMEKGRFLNFCEKARYSESPCCMIIDEINRANLSRVFGELMYLLEYRNREIPLAGGNRFSIPPNVRIIGTMNTADRSIALVDHALRRRFAFLSLYPKYDILEKYHSDSDFPIDRLIDVLRNLNQQINDRHYEVGITFFLHRKLRQSIKDIWEMEIEPYLEEYFFDQPEKTDEFRWEKIKDKILI